MPRGEGIEQGQKLCALARVQGRANILFMHLDGYFRPREMARTLRGEEYGIRSFVARGCLALQQAPRLEAIEGWHESRAVQPCRDSELILLQTGVGLHDDKEAKKTRREVQVGQGFIERRKDRHLGKSDSIAHQAGKHSQRRRVCWPPSLILIAG